MIVYKVKSKKTGKFLSKHGFSNAGRIYTNKGFIKTSIYGWKTRTDLEVVEFDLVELKTQDINTL